MIKQVEKSRYAETVSELEQASEASIQEEEKILEEEAKLLSQNDSVLEDIVNEIREDPSKAMYKRNRKIFSYCIESNKAEFSSLKQEVEELKNDLIKNVEKDPKSFSLNISNKSILKNFYIDVFGQAGNVISFKDYTTLLELKRVLEIDEQISISEVEKVWAFLKNSKMV